MARITDDTNHVLAVHAEILRRSRNLRGKPRRLIEAHQELIRALALAKARAAQGLGLARHRHVVRAARGKADR